MAARRPVSLLVFIQLLTAFSVTVRNVQAGLRAVDPDGCTTGQLLPQSASTLFKWCDYNDHHVQIEGGLVGIFLEAESQEVGNTTQWKGSGARIHTDKRYHVGTFSASIRCPVEEGAGLVAGLYLSSRESDDKIKFHDEVDWEWKLQNKSRVQTNYFVRGQGGHEDKEPLELGFSCDDAFHLYSIRWTDSSIIWSVDGIPRRTVLRQPKEPFPVQPMMVYGTLWDASVFGSWAGAYAGQNATLLLANLTVEQPSLDPVAPAVRGPPPDFHTDSVLESWEFWGYVVAFGVIVGIVCIVKVCYHLWAKYSN